MRSEQRKIEFWWASIHGADPEPVEKTEYDGRPCVYTPAIEAEKARISRYNAAHGWRGPR